jgi:predicted NBD/HSP70 family sugar kinase
VVDRGEKCQCGNTGCLETVISSRALVRQYQARSQADPSLEKISNFTFDQFCHLFDLGDATARQVADEAAAALGAAIAAMIGALGPCRIVLAGSVSRLGQDFTAQVRKETLRRYRLPLASEIEVAVSELGANFVLLGASALLLPNELGISRRLAVPETVLF